MRRKKLTIIALTVLVLLALAEFFASAAIIIVDDDAPNDPGPGNPNISDPCENGSPAHPFDTIWEGVDAASHGYTIQVAAGTYTQNIEIHSKIGLTLTGNIGDHDNPLNSATNTIINTKYGIGIKSSNGTVLENLVITEARKDYYTGKGGAILVQDSVDVTIRDNIVINNEAADGAGIYCENCKRTLISRNIFRENNGHHGGAIYIHSDNYNPTFCAAIMDNEIINNHSWQIAAGIRVDKTYVMICRNLIYSNQSDSCGGLCLNSAGGEIKNNIIVKNNGDHTGTGAIGCNNSPVFIINNVIYKNRAPQSYAKVGGIKIQGEFTPVLKNNIITENEKEGVYCSGDSFVSLIYNDVNNNGTDYFGCLPGMGSISKPPLFVAPDIDNDPYNDDYSLQLDSPCIDAGDPCSDFNDPDGSQNDMGAYGGNSCVPGFVADVDEDDLPDAEELIRGTDPYNPDTDDDGALDGEEVYTYGTDPNLADTDDDGESDGVEIEIETNPSDPNSNPAFIRTITFDDVIRESFLLSQQEYNAPVIQDIPVLDPPVDGRFESKGLTFQESNKIKCQNLIDKLQTYAYARPRASLDKLRFRVYVDENNDGTYELKTYADANPDYSSSEIQPPIETELLPIAGKVLSRFIVGHLQHYNSKDEYPQFFDFSAVGYVRFNGFMPQTVGSSYRIALHNVFDTNEDFPRFREIYFRADSNIVSNLMAIVDSEGFTGAVNMDLTPAEETIMCVMTKFFPRRDIKIADESNTGLVGYSSMFWKNEEDTPEDSNDEAHDCDILVVGYDRNGDGIVDIIKEKAIEIPASIGDVNTTDFGTLQDGNQIYFALENRDLDMSHYLKYKDAHYENRSSYSIQIISSDVNVSLILYEAYTDCEYNDNIVINLAIKNDLRDANSVDDAVSIEYITKAYFPIDTDEDGLTDQLEGFIGTDISNKDSDYDGVGDYDELLAGTDPLCMVEFCDFARFAEQWRHSGTGLAADLYEDEENIVNEFDLGVFVDYWLCYCPVGWPLE